MILFHLRIEVKVLQNHFRRVGVHFSRLYFLKHARKYTRERIFIFMIVHGTALSVLIISVERGVHAFGSILTTNYLVVTDCLPQKTIAKLN